MKQAGAIAVFLACVFCLTTSGYSAPEMVYSEGERTSLSYKLKNPRVISSGQTFSDTSGVLTYDYVIQADAIPQGPTGTGTAVFQASLSSFKPSHNLPGQQAGRWYLQGVWTIEPVSSTASSAKKRHESVHYRGMLKSVLTFDPLQAPNGDFSADIDIPTSLSGDGWLSGSGAFKGDTSFSGIIVLDIDKPAQAKLTYGQEVKP